MFCHIQNRLSLLSGLLVFDEDDGGEDGRKEESLISIEDGPDVRWNASRPRGDQPLEEYVC